MATSFESSEPMDFGPWLTLTSKGLREPIMSQHYIAPLDPSRHQVVIGYDRPLDEFFGQIIDLVNENTDEELLEWINTKSVTTLRNALAPYANLTVELAKELWAERIDRDNHPMNKIVHHV